MKSKKARSSWKQRGGNVGPPVFVFETDVIGDSVALPLGEGPSEVLLEVVPQQIIRDGPAARRACETVCRRRRP